MSPLTGFIIVVVAITFQFTLYAIRRFQEPLIPAIDEIKSSPKNKKSDNNYWKNAEITNGRLAMLGLLALVVNYGLFGWIILGVF